MKAVVATQFGPADVMELQEFPDLEPAAHQVVVDVEFAAVGTLDRLVRSGWGREFFDIRPPYVPGDGVGGVIRAVGPGVDSSLIGQRVVGGTGPRGEDGMSTGPTGGYADTALVDIRAMVRVPDEVSLETATALLNDGPTCEMLLDATDPGPGDIALVLSASGAAGILLVQAAAARGAVVIAAAHGSTKTEALRLMGVQHVIDYSADDWVRQVRALAPAGVSVLFDGAGATLGNTGAELVGEGGRIASYGSSAGDFARPDIDALRDRGIVFKGLFDLQPQVAGSRRELTLRAFQAATAGVAEPVVTLVPLADAARAHRALEERTAIGKILLTS
ncbi:zinc-binding dehydrogenase [Flexivirga sp. B27]